MHISRRFVLSALPATLAAATLPLGARRGWALTTFSSGDLRIDSLSDGHLELPAEFFLTSLPEERKPEIEERFGLPESGVVESPLNVTLMRQGDRVVLFDAGSGPDFVPTAGLLVDALAAIDVAPEDVTDVIFTHGHPDHLWGLLDDFDEPLFANAALHMAETEYAYWTDPQTVETIGEEFQSFAVGAMRRLSAVGDSVQTFADGDEVLPGIRAVSTPGHTPGHCSFAIGSPSDGIFVTGDFVTTEAAMAWTDLGTSTDSDPALAAQTRAATLAMLADEGWTVLGYHLPNGGIGRVVADGEGEGFRFEQEE